MSALRPVISRTAGAVTATIATALLTMAVPAASSVAAATRPSAGLRVGTLTLRRCAWVTARLTVHPDGGAPVRLTGRWLAFGQQEQVAVVHGMQGGRRLAATCPAP
jgi:hypothetical protein